MCVNTSSIYTYNSSRCNHLTKRHIKKFFPRTILRKLHLTWLYVDLQSLVTENYVCEWCGFETIWGKKLSMCVNEPPDCDLLVIVETLSRNRFIFGNSQKQNCEKSYSSTAFENKLPIVWEQTSLWFMSLTCNAVLWLLYTAILRNDRMKISFSSVQNCSLYEQGFGFKFYHFQGVVNKIEDWRNYIQHNLLLPQLLLRSSL